MALNGLMPSTLRWWLGFHPLTPLLAWVDAGPPQIPSLGPRLAMAAGIRSGVVQVVMVMGDNWVLAVSLRFLKTSTALLGLNPAKLRWNSHGGHG